MTRVSSREALKQPFGPWREDTVLDHKWQTRQGAVLTLHDVLLSKDWKPVGVGATSYLPQEDSGDPQPPAPTYFSGVLFIEDPFKLLFNRGVRKDWLTDTGWDVLSAQYRERTGQLWKDSHLHFEGCVLKIRIVGQVCNAIRYLEDNDPYAPTDLKMVSLYYFGDRDRGRKFRVKSLHPSTYELSRTFMAHQKFFRELHDIVTKESGSSNRDLEWFIKQYRTRRMHDPPDLARKRLSYVASWPEYPDKPPNRPNGFLLKGEKRKARERSKTEVRSYFCMHAPWIANQAALKQTQITRLKIDMGAWEQQTYALLAIRELARKEWHDGSAFGKNWMMGDNAEEEGEIKKFKELYAGRPRKTTVKSRKKSHSAKAKTNPAKERPHYDHGLMYSSSASEPDVLSDDEPPLTEDEKRMYGGVPPWGHDMPCLEDDCSWYCPQYSIGCPYHFNLRTLGPQERAYLPGYVVRGLDSRLWRPSDPWVINTLRTLADAHYDAHLERINMRKTCVIRKIGSTVVTYAWIAR